MNDNDTLMLEKSIVLAVDDDAENLVLLVNVLKHFYKVKVANGGKKTIEIASVPNGERPDLILLDVMMPDINGFEVCQQLKDNPLTKDIPILFLTSKSETIDQKTGFKLGAVDYITKPIDPELVRVRVKTHLMLKKSKDSLKNQNSFLENMVRIRTAEINAIQDVTIQAMTSMAETRDNETGHHIRRTQHYVKILAEKLRFHPRFIHFLNNDHVIDSLFKSAPLHDVGKIGIPDRILLKNGRLTEEEFEVMKTHPTLGRGCIERAELDLGINIPFFSMVKDIVYGHHEKWDGSGYPEGLSGEAIPISARLMALADVYDALISRRVYKEGMLHEKAVQIILDGNGIHFDPDIIEAFCQLQREFQEIAEIYKD